MAPHPEQPPVDEPPQPHYEPSTSWRQIAVIVLVMAVVLVGLIFFVLSL